MGNDPNKGEHTPDPDKGKGKGNGDGPPKPEPRRIQIKLRQEQIDRLVADGTLEVDEDQFTGVVRERMSQLTARAKTAEEELAAIVATREETERKALEEQEKFKELYEKERAAHEQTGAARKDDLLRSRFLLGATKAGVVDPDAAYLLAKSLSTFAQVQVNDQGEVTGLEPLLKELVEAKPYLLSGKTSTVGSPTNPTQKTQDQPPAETQEEANRRIRDAVQKGGGLTPSTP